VPLSEFGVAVSDAIKHGFRPKLHHWIVTNRTGTTHFHPGNAPIFVPSDSLPVKRPVARRRAHVITKSASAPHELTSTMANVLVEREVRRQK
jgi:hypothetical protein